MENKLTNMPKVELHLHLDGAVRVETAYEYIKYYDDRITINELTDKMVVGSQLKNQEELLRFFDIPSIVLQSKEALERAAFECVLDRAAENIVYMEIRFAPLIHTAKGLTADDAMRAVIAGIEKGRRKTGADVSLIVAALRSHSVSENIAMLAGVDTFRGDIFNAVDFAGPEKRYPNPLTQLAYFKKAKDMGFYLTFHCGEIKNNSAFMLEAVKKIIPDRIAHGAAAYENCGLMAFLKDHNIMLDLCPTSNIQAGLFNSYSDFPIKKYFENGVPVSISTDDPVLSNISLTDEYKNLIRHCGVQSEEILWINKMTAGKIFAPERIRKKLMNKIEKFEEQNYGIR